ncbi:MAG: Spy/CpxP family protein refolding chaperone [Armatimonadetes bacterium]|nr:Spy/CpxP family protein refolding chaperone [Armatimonadota bacterium]
MLAVVAVVSSMALAQDGRQRRGGMFQRGGPGLLMRPDVQKELKITSSQISKIESMLESQRGQRFAGGGGGRGGNDGGGRRGGGGGRGGFRGGGGGLSPEMVKSLKGILDEAQYKRFEELSLQQAGGFALNREDIAKKLNLTSKQKNELQELNQDMRADMQDMFSGGGGGGDRQAMMEEMQSLREDYGKDMLKVLTGDQKKIWATMVGKKFKFQQIDR